MTPTGADSDRATSALCPLGFPMGTVLATHGKVLVVEGSGGAAEWPLREERRGCPVSDTASSSSTVDPPHNTAEPLSTLVAPLGKHIPERAKEVRQRELEGTKRVGKSRGNTHPAWTGKGVWCEALKLSRHRGEERRCFTFVFLFLTTCICFNWQRMNFAQVKPDFPTRVFAKPCPCVYLEP